MFGEEVEYPFAELLVSGGFFFVMVIEQIVMEWFGRKQSIKTSICDSKKKIKAVENRSFNSIFSFVVLAKLTIIFWFGCFIEKLGFCTSVKLKS